jgi:hypothetical protein
MDMIHDKSLAAIDDVFTAVTSIVEISRSIVIDQHMTINRSITEIEQGAVEHIHERAAGGVRCGNTDAQALILSPERAVVPEILPCTAYNWKKVYTISMCTVSTRVPTITWHEDGP